MERLTIKSEIVSGHYNLKCMCTVCTNGIVDSEDGCVEYCELHDDCNDCQIQEAFDRLAAYEDTGLTPEEIVVLQADNKRLHELVDILEGAIKAL